MLKDQIKKIKESKKKKKSREQKRVHYDLSHMLLWNYKKLGES